MLGLWASPQIRGAAFKHMKSLLITVQVPLAQIVLFLTTSRDVKLCNEIIFFAMALPAVIGYLCERLYP
jgi:hypothetical protein